MKLESEFLKVFDGLINKSKKTSAYDTDAEVVRVDSDGTAWVHIPNGVPETPAKLAVDAKASDKVRVRVSGKKAVVTGNITAPPTDDKVANEAKAIARGADKKAEKVSEAVEDVAEAADSASRAAEEAARVSAIAQEAAETAESIANQALTGVGNLSNHFWYDSSGAHVAENAGTVETGASMTIASSGTVMMRNGKLISSWTGSSASNAALNFYDCSDASASTGDLMSSFTRQGINLYVMNRLTASFTQSALQFYDAAKSNPANYPTASFSGSGVSLYASENSVNAEVAFFGSNLVELGKNSASSVINMCGGSVLISAENEQTSSKDDKWVSIKAQPVYASHDTIKNYYRNISLFSELNINDIAGSSSIDLDVDFRQSDKMYAAIKMVADAGVDAGYTAQIIAESSPEESVITLNATKIVIGDDVTKRDFAAYVTKTGGVGVLRDAEVSKWGRLVMIRFNFTSTGQVASGANFFTGTVDEGVLIGNPKFLPIEAAIGIGYYGAHTFQLTYNTVGEIIVRNASSSAVAAITGSNVVGISLVFLSKN